VYQPLPEFASFGAGTSGIAIAPNSHIGVVAGEFGTQSFGAIVMPASSGSGTPALVDWVAASVPNTPDGQTWQMGLDPHTLTAYTSPTTGKQYAVFEDDVPLFTGTRPWLAVVDLQALLARSRSGGHSLATPLGTADTCGGPSPNPTGCIVRFLNLP
jgi:hypothetical protein